jgi:hypothetical protein
MTELERIAMQVDLTKLLDDWIEKQADAYSVYCCSELSRMMASTALAVAEASTRSEAESLVGSRRREAVSGVDEAMKARLLANHHEFVLGEFVVPPWVSFLAITNERGLFVQERIGDRMFPVCKYCFRLCEKQDSAYCCTECLGVRLKAMLEELSSS